MNPGRELDALVAEKVMKLDVNQDHDEMDKYWITSGNGGYLCPDYSTDRAAAWEVVAKIVHPEFVSSWRFDIRVENWPRKFRAKFSNGGGAYVAEEDSAPHAICIAALKAVGAI